MHPHIQAIHPLADGHARLLPADDGMPPSWHLWKKSEVNALILALAIERPLLVRGEPGTGKSQLARAAAAALGWRLHTSTLYARSEAQDLLFQYDAVRRLADAQGGRWKDTGWTDEIEKTYWEPKCLWRAMDWVGAQGYGSLAQANAPTESSADRHVVLIDEIDKAPSDVPNGLLEVLGARRFEVPGLGVHVNAQSGHWPLVIITTNEERELPHAFLRRCVVLTHDSQADGGYRAFLVDHGQAHFGARREAKAVNDPAQLTDTVLGRAADMLVKDREAAKLASLPPPGLAEYLDLLTALHAIAPAQEAAQLEWLDELNQYAYLKHRVEEGEGANLGLKQNASGSRPWLPSTGQPRA